MEGSPNPEIKPAVASLNSEDQNTRQEANTSGGNENKQLIIEIRERFGRLKNQESPQCHIQKVPYHIRKWNEEAYTPQVISIGPFHCENTRLKSMKEHKERYFKSFIEQREIKLEDVVSKIRDLEESIRGCYVETIELKSDEFVKMILVDACFILELFIRSCSESSTRDDPMILDPMASVILHDLLLLENQLPFFVIKEIFTDQDALIDLTSKYFKLFTIRIDHWKVEIKHFTDLIRTSMLPLEKPGRVSLWNELLYSVTQLHEAGVEFEEVSNGSFLDIKFENGVLKIPLIKLDDWTEIVARNVMALEQTHYLEHGYITDYYWLLDSLINTERDVDLLCENKVMDNSLGDNDAIKSMINKLNKGILWNNMSSDYYDLCLKLKRFYINPWHRWKATLRRQYFSNPWRTAATIAAIILLLLTFVQTVWSIIYK